MLLLTNSPGDCLCVCQAGFAPSQFLHLLRLKRRRWRRRHPLLGLPPTHSAREGGGTRTLLVFSTALLPLLPRPLEAPTHRQQKPLRRPPTPPFPSAFHVQVRTVQVFLSFLLLAAALVSIPSHRTS